jgi:hypothetical protein
MEITFQPGFQRGQTVARSLLFKLISWFPLAFSVSLVSGFHPFSSPGLDSAGLCEVPPPPQHLLSGAETTDGQLDTCCSPRDTDSYRLWPVLEPEGVT